MRKKESTISWQTLSLQKTGLLFTTPELRRLGNEWERDQKEYDKIQSRIVSQAVSVARTYAQPMQEGGRLLAELDALLALSRVAANLEWTRPKLVEPPTGQR